MVCSDERRPTTFQEAASLIAADIVGLLASKQRDYGQGNILKFRELGIVVRTSDKMERLINLLWSSKGATPEGEAVDDTWTDLAGYSILALMLRRGWFELPMEGSNE